MRSLILTLAILFTTLMSYGQKKIYKNLVSGMDKVLVLESLKNDINISGGQFEIYSMMISTNRVKFNLMFNQKDKLYGISFWTDESFDATKYSANIPVIIKDFSYAIEKSNGKPNESRNIPDVNALAFNKTYLVKAWWDEKKNTRIEIDNSKDFISKEIKYFVRLTIVDYNYAPTIEDHNDF